ncbi:MFS transporter [Serinicoccus kebangsaanensis]|uniref:MFS transporter n=1 Tax=Serinicoccus kebangsaanensis TaxID=2602069 RepID=UPI00192D3E9F|nr:MFS transporter [Serinicoccus kebangsaanensis]
MRRGVETDARRLGGNFWHLFGASATSNVSDGVMQAAAPLLAATLTRDPFLVSLLASLAFLPWLLFAIPAGTLVDRVDRRRAMAGANLLRALAIVALAVSVVTGWVSLPVLYAVALVLGTAEVVYDSAARALLPRVVPKRQLERGNSLLTTAESTGQIFLGPPVGAWLFAIAASLPLFGGATAYLVAGALVLLVAGRFRPERETTTTAGQDTREGLAWLRRHPILFPLMLTTGVAATLGTMTSGILVLFVLEELGLSERAFGLFLAVAGVGAIAGSLLSPLATRLMGRTTSMGVLQLVSAVAVTVMGLWVHPVVAVAGLAVSAGSVTAFNVQIMSVRQAIIPERLFGRVQGAYRTVIWGGIPVGTLLGGLLGRLLGLPAVFVLTGVGSGLAGLGVWWVLHRHRVAIEAAFDEDESAGRADAAPGIPNDL